MTKGRRKQIKLGKLTFFVKVINAHVILWNRDVEPTYRGHKDAARRAQQLHSFYHRKRP